VVLAITAFSWMDTARLVRGQTLSLRKMEFVEAARAMGVSTPRIVFEHIVPNLMGLVLVYATVTVPSVILTESVMSFLGLGIQEPMTSWGVLIHDGAQMLDSAAWLLILPALMLSLTLYSFNYLGDGLRDALDPKDR
jgi:oligopeptide transport system permease protein